MRSDLLKGYRPVAVVLGLAVVGSVGWKLFQGSGFGEEADHEVAVEELVASEEWMEFMGAEMNALAGKIGSLPVREGEPFSAMEGGVTGEGVAGPVREEKGPGGVSWKDYDFGTEAGDGGAGLWGFLDEELAEVTKGKFGFLRGEFTDEAREGFSAKVIFSAEGKVGGGGVGAFEAVQEVRWTLKDGGQAPTAGNDYVIDPKEWEITGWKMVEARLTKAERPLFREVTRELIPDEEDQRRIEFTDHAYYLGKLFKGEEIPLKSGYGRYFTTDATAQHPGLSVVDIDGDGRDDLYVCVRFGRNMLFRDQGDGTFKEVAADYGLDLEGVSAVSLFADFDNDGDQDVVVGRSLERSVYLRNEGGRFVDCSESHVGSPLPYLTTSLAAADFNGDGLLDLYFSTYGFAIRQPRDQVAKDFLADYPAGEVTGRFVSPPDVEPYLNLPGPPNVLLVNTGGGKFEVSPLSGQVAAWRETLQATWADYDQDGDPDLYVCNDFAPDVLYRNEGGEGFVDVTREVGHERMRGFGMGASFGDFDNDQDLDLYVSNMFSKAGLRIIDKVGMKDERFRWSAEGNLLFDNRSGEGFGFLSGEGSPFAPVARADWSWGGQFCDFDNDGFLDLYVPNGYFTAPEAFAGEVDL